MAAAAFLVVPGSGFAEAPGTCLPPPSEWPLPPWLSWLANLGTLLLSAAGLAVLNRRFSFVAGTDTLLPAAFMVLAASCPCDVQRLSAGSVLAVANVAALSLLFGCSESRNNTQNATSRPLRCSRSARHSRRRS